MTAREARIVGAGLIGTSIALRLRECGWSVQIKDENNSTESIAIDLVGASQSIEDPEIVVVATPPRAVIQTLKDEYASNPESTFIDVTSTKYNLEVEVLSISGLRERFVGTHPIAGREMVGPHSARSDLFDGRAWVVTPAPGSNPTLVESVESFISELGAIPYRMSAKEHDQLFAQISHLPQIMSTALASSLENLGEEIDISGQGLRDMLRLAGSNGQLWAEILLSNQEEVLSAVTTFHSRLKELELAISRGESKEIEEIFNFANAIHATLSGKHGSRPRKYTYLNIVIEDKPGQLGALFNECAEISANVEDLALEHSPKQETGLIRLALSESDAQRLQSHLSSKGWRVHLQ